MVNGQATSALVTSRNVLGLIGQTQAALNLSGGRGTMVPANCHGVESGKRGFVLAAKLHAECRFDETLRVSQSGKESPRHRARRLFAFSLPPSLVISSE